MDYYSIQYTNTGTVHAYTELRVRDEPYFTTACGKSVDPWAPEWLTEHRDITCKVCRNTLRVSVEFRIARQLVEACEGLIEDMKACPGAYLHADHSRISRIESICQRSHTELAI